MNLYRRYDELIFEYALDLAGRPEACWMIGDNPAADIAGGKTAGLRTVLVRHESAEGAFKNPDPCGADFVCRNLAEIPALLG